MCQKYKILQEMHLKSVDYFKYISVIDIGLLWWLPTPSSADREKGDGTVYTWKDYADKAFEAILRTHSSISMIIDVNGFYGKGVINVEGGLTSTSKHQINIKSALLSILVARREVYSLWRKHIFQV